MAYRTRSARRVVRKSKYHFLITITISIFLLYAAVFWILPNLVNGLGLITGFFKEPKSIVKSVSEDPNLAPPVLNIPFEATNSAQIDITGYSTNHSKIKIFVDDEEKSEVEAETDGSFIARNIDLSLGTNNIYGKSVGDNGKESLPSKLIPLIFDDEKPTMELTEPDDGKEVTGDRKVKISGKTDPGTKVYINDSQVIVNSEGNFSTDKSLNDGDNNFNVKSVDNAGNTTEVARKVIFKP